MSRNTMRMEAAPDEVFAVLTDARSYEHWVVGCDDIRAVEGDWPAVGSRFFHTVGVGPFKVKDNTKVIEVESPHRLILEARARPAGVAKVDFILTPVDGGRACEVTITERPTSGPAKRFDNPVLHHLIYLRNAETLRRLRKQVDQRKAVAPQR